MKNTINAKEQNKFQIKSIRADWWDYSSNGIYFITICTKNMRPSFGILNQEEVILNKVGEVAKTIWNKIPHYFPFASLRAFVIMPNHLHGIILFEKSTTIKNNTAAKFGPQSNNLGSIIRGFKSSVTIEARKTDFEFAWQSRFYDRIIRNENELENIIQYIYDNPIKG